MFGNFGKTRRKRKHGLYKYHKNVQFLDKQSTAFRQSKQESELNTKPPHCVNAAGRLQRISEPLAELALSHLLDCLAVRFHFRQLVFRILCMYRLLEIFLAFHHSTLFPYGSRLGDGRAMGIKSRKKPTERSRLPWLGHACFFVEFPPSVGNRRVRILFDPVFSDRCSPSQWVGPKRYTRMSSFFSFSALLNFIRHP